MSKFSALDLPVTPDVPKPSNAQTRELLKAASRGYDYSVMPGPSTWSGARNPHEHKLVEAIHEMWPVLARDRRVALVPELPPVPEGERYHSEFVSPWALVQFDMTAQKVGVIVHGGGLAAAEQALLVALAMVREAAALGPQSAGRGAQVDGQEELA